MLNHPETRCDICGLPNYELHRYWLKGPWFKHLGGRRSGRRLQLDHIHPGENDGHYRPLCPACNRKRGANEFTDEDVLVWVRSKWQFVITLRFLWWLHSAPGEGGRLHRSARTEKRDKSYYEHLPRGEAPPRVE